MMKFIPCIALACSVSSCALAQTPPEPPPPPLGPEVAGQMLGGPLRHDLLFAAGTQLEQERIVQGAPYCADAVQETVQQLNDGNRIVHKQSSRQCRDGQGRTRQEVTTRGGRAKVYVRDPVAKEAWMMEPDLKLAVRLDLPRQPLLGPEPRMLERWSERMRDWSREFSQQMKEKFKLGSASVPAVPPVPPVPPFPPVNADAIRMSVHAALAGAMPPPVAMHARLLGPRGPGTTTLLPGETIEGVRADGKRTVWTIEAGRIGNEKPITITNEVWSSPELGITLKTRDVDPVAGEDTFTVRNVVRGEPDAQLFRVPADYSKVSPPALNARGK